MPAGLDVIVFEIFVVCTTHPSLNAAIVGVHHQKAGIEHAVVVFDGVEWRHLLGLFSFPAEDRHFDGLFKNSHDFLWFTSLFFQRNIALGLADLPH